jgi:hypothetical protein
MSSGRWGADVDAGESCSGDRTQDDSAASGAEMGDGGNAQGSGNASMARQVAEPGCVAATATGAWQERRGPRPAHEVLDHLRQRPGTSAAGEKPAGQYAVASQPSGASRRRSGAQSAQLHDGPGRRVERVWHVVDCPEHPGLARADVVASGSDGREQQRPSPNS